MFMRQTEMGRCPYCGSSLRYGVKEEPTAWKVLFECIDSNCTGEFSAGRIPRSEVDHLDEVYERAEGLHIRI